MAGPKLNRREILSAGVMVGSTVALNSAVLTDAQARSIGGEVPWQPGVANKPDIAVPGSYEYLSSAEVEFLEAAVSRLIPKDELGPGAKEAGVTFFLDRQLGGAYGHAAHWYMQGPWKKGDPTQGYQSRMTPAELYRAAIKAVDAYCGDKFAGKTFATLTGVQQDEVLKALESGDADLKGVDGKSFFTMLWQNTQEGFFSDPLYGGNRDMAGWKLVGFPGARYDYRPYVKKHGEKLNLEPVGITGRPGWKPA